MMLGSLKHNSDPVFLYNLILIALIRLCILAFSFILNYAGRQFGCLIAGTATGNTKVNSGHKQSSLDKHMAAHRF